MAEREAGKQREGLSIQTLVIAAIASAVAAVIVSTFWQSGTIVAAAMTPVVISIVRELLQRPMESEAVKRAASRMTEMPSGRVLAGAAQRSEDVRRSGRTTSTPPPPAPNGDGQGDTTPGDVVLSHPRRTYSTGGRGRRRRPRLKVAVVTGILAFVIAALVLTLPELLFGGPVGSSGGRTTLFGGDRQSQTEDRDGGSNQQDSGGQPQANPQAPEEGDEQQPVPEEEPTEPAPAPPATEPQPPSDGTPAPAPAPSTP